MSAQIQPNEQAITSLAEIIDLERYPIHDLHNEKTQQVIQASRERLDYDGCALIKDFILPKSILRMQEEADRLYDQTFWSEASHTPYFNIDDPSSTFKCIFVYSECSYQRIYIT